jgi:hypothetical protein
MDGGAGFGVVDQAEIIKMNMIVCKDWLVKGSYIEMLSAISFQ